MGPQDEETKKTFFFFKQFSLDKKCLQKECEVKTNRMCCWLCGNSLILSVDSITRQNCTGSFVLIIDSGEVCHFVKPGVQLLRVG